MASFPGRIALQFALWATAGAFSAQPAQLTESEAKAAFLQRIVGFVTWPEGSAPRGAVKIAFLGRSEVARELDRLQKGAATGGRKIEVRVEPPDSACEGCHVVVLPGSEPRRLQAFADRWGGRPVLTVSESALGCERGVLLSLLVAEDRIRYEINLRRTRRAGLSFHSQVLQWAARVCEGGSP